MENEKNSEEKKSDSTPDKNDMSGNKSGDGEISYGIDFMETLGVPAGEN